MELLVLQVLSALLLMLVLAEMLALLLLQLELTATTLVLLLHVLALALLYQRACSACASAFERQPLHTTNMFDEAEGTASVSQRGACVHALLLLVPALHLPRGLVART